MKLGLGIGYSGAQLNVPIDRIKLAESVGYDSVWTAENYGSDAITVLAWIAAQTGRIRLGTGVMQISGRPAAMAAMQAQTVDAMAGGHRVIAGLGVSGPQIVEGWYGEPWGSPYWRLRDYVQIFRKVNQRKEPVQHQGREISLPYSGPGATGLGKPLKLILHTNPDLPIWLGCGGESSVKLCAELCDGWLPHGFSPGRMSRFKPWLEEGFRRGGNAKGWDTFEIQASGRVQLTDDVAGAIRAAKDTVALMVGGMGHRTMNFHRNRMQEAGYGDAADRVQELFLAGRKKDAAEAIPDEYVEEGGLFGSPERIGRRWEAWADSGITGFTVVTDQPEAITLMADLAGTRSGAGRGLD